MARLTALENRLRRDTQGLVRDQLLAQLQVGEQQLLQSQGEQSQTVLLLNACRRSAEVISALWARYHYQ